MNPLDPSPHTPAKNTLHPIMVIAAVAVVLFCGVGSAALLGWLPSSTAGGTPATTAQAGAAPVGQLSSTPPPVNGYAAAPSAAPTQLAQADTGQPAPVPMNDERPAAPPCGNCGVVEAVHEVQQRGQGSGAGAAGGAILGGLLGNQVGSGHGRQLATVAGAAGGAYAGNKVEQKMKSTRQWTVQVQYEDGKQASFHFDHDPGLMSGDRVRNVNGSIVRN